MADEVNERAGMVTGTISVDTSVLEEIIEILTRLESVPEFPLEHFLSLLLGILDSLDSSALVSAPDASDNGIVLKFGGVLELFAAALRALDGHFGHS